MSVVRADMDTELHRAARAGPVSNLQAMLANPQTKKLINAKDGMQRTALHIAAEEGARDKVLLLLQHGADATATDRNMWTPLHCAASQGFLGLIEPLVEKGAPINAQTREGSPPISYLPKAQDSIELYNTISYLIARGANPNLANSHGETALHKACFKGRIHAVRALIERGATIHAKAKGNETPLHFAVKGGRAPVVRLLLERGADPNSPSEYGTPAKAALASTPEVQQAMSDLIIEAETASVPFLDIHLHDFAAVDLPRKTFGSVDPYVVVRLDGIEMRSEPVHKSSSPTFRFSAQMTYALSELAGLADKSVQVEVRDGNDMLGMCSLDLLSLTTGPSVMQNISLLDHKGGSKGKKGRISFVAEVTYKRRVFISIRNVVLKNLRPASNAPHVNWKNDVFLEAQINPMTPFQSPVVYNTYEPSWQELPALCICAGLKELLSNKKVKFQAFNNYKGDSELLGECELDLTKMVLSAQASQHYREDLTFRGAAFGSLDCQVQVQHLPEVAQLGGLRTDDGFFETQAITDFVLLPKGFTPSKTPQYTRDSSASGVSPDVRGQRHRKVGDLVELLKQQSCKATAELADLVWRDDTARDALREEHGFAPLAKLLSTEGDLQREAARLLLNALFEHPANQEAFRLARGVPALVEALSHGRSAAQLPMVLALAALAARDSLTQQAICDANGIPTLIGILQSNTNGHVKLVVASTLGKLCYTSTGVASKIPDVIRLAGGMRALVDLMVTSDVDAELRPVVCETVILALKMLCDNSAENVKALLPLLVTLFALPDQDVQLLAFAIVRDISSRSEELSGVCQNSIGIARFLTALASPYEAVRTEALILFKQLFRKNKNGPPVLNASMLASSLPPCLSLLQSNDPTVLRLVFKTLKLLAQMAVELAVSGVVPRVVAHLRSADPIMQEKALSFIALLAQDPKARESLYDLDFMLLTRFLGAENQKIQSLACNVATLLLGDSQRKHDLSRAGALPAVVKLLNGDDLALLATALQLLQGFSDAQENRPVLLDCGVMTGLESVIRLYGDSELLLPALAIIQSLCTSPKAEAAIVNSPILACFEALLANPYPNPQARDAMQKILTDIGYSTGVCTQAHRANAAESLQQDFYHCLTCGVMQPGGICEGCALVCHKGHSLSAKYRDHIVCTCGNAPNNVCQSLVLSKPVPPPLSVCSAAFNKANRPQTLFRCRTCWADTPKHVCKRCAEECHKDHLLNNMNTIVGVCSCNDRVYNKCGIFTVQKPGEKSPAAAAQAAVVPAAAAAPAAPKGGDDKGECIICMDAPKEALFYKCGHIASCMECANGMKGKPCPICREPVLDVVKIFKI